jgi:hypothetical protein
MSVNETIDETSIIPIEPVVAREIQIAGAPAVRLQTLDYARHIAITPDKRHYVVATFDDTRLGRKFVTAVFPQQNGYLTLVRLPVCEFQAENPEEALQRHVALIQAIQQGKLKEFIKANSSR